MCQFKKSYFQTTTDANGKYDFANGIEGIRKAEGYRISIASQGRNLSLNLDRRERVAIDLFNLSGKFARNVVDADLGAGLHSLTMLTPEGTDGLYLVRVRTGSEVAWHKLTLQGSFASISNVGFSSITGSGVPGAGSSAPETGSGVPKDGALAKSGATVDSLFCTSPDFSGGLAHINGREVTSYAGTANFRMFSLDTAWASQCVMPITFNFDSSAGVAKYKKLVPDWVGTEQEVLREVCQSTFKTATEPQKYPTYIANIKSMGGVAFSGGNGLSFSADYINGQPDSYAGWWEVVGVQTHEAVHSYQAYYSTPGADGFGEAMPDAVRALNGFFSWPSGTKCDGSFTDAYQTGGKYWYYIEMMHPGFITSVWQNPTGDISNRVQTITGESLASMAAACQTKGMP